MILHLIAGNSAEVPVVAFMWAFIIIGGMSALSSLWFARLAHDAGAELAGRTDRAAPTSDIEGGLGPTR